MKILGHVIKPDSSAETTQQITESVSEPADRDLPADINTIGRLAVNGKVTGKHYAGTLNVDPPIYDVDWFAFKAEANSDYQFTANPGEKFPRLHVLRIFNDVGVERRNSLIAEKNNQYSAPNRLNTIAFREDTAGIYFVSIESWYGNSSPVAYTLAMFGDDYSNDITTTGVVDVGESIQNYLMRTDANPDSSRTGDVDWIRVALEEDVTYKIVYDVACLHQGRIEGIYGPDGTLLPSTTNKEWPFDWPRKTERVVYRPHHPIHPVVRRRPLHRRLRPRIPFPDRVR